MFILSKLFWLFFSPTSTLVWLAIIGLVLLFVGRHQAGVGVLSALAVLTLIIAATPIGPLAIRGLEAEHVRPNPLPTEVSGIILLGGAEQPQISQERGAPSLTGAGERYLAFAELARQYPKAPLYFSGGVGQLDQSVPPETEVMKQAALGLGIDLARIQIDGKARNTRENAMALRAMIETKPDQAPFLLITSAFHMPRAIYYFDWQKIPVIAYPCDWRSHKELEWFPGLARGLDQLSTGLRERVGMLAAQMH